MNTGTPLLIARGLHTGYRSGGKKTLVSAHLPELSIQAGRLICLLGPNGSGKSTLLRTLAGLQPSMGGSVEIGGRTGLSSRELARQISLVLTDRVGGSNLDVRSLVTLGRYPWSGWLGLLTEADKAIIQRAVEAADIGPLLHRKTYTLSDGESQKVMLARALAQDTPILMLDEPTAHLDLPSRIRLMRLLHRLAREMNKGILLSTHELDLALQAADEVWLLQSAGPLEKGVPEDLVLGGIFEAAFEKEDVHFDRAKGLFRIHPEGNRAIELTGTGVAAFWTRRALEREGFAIPETAERGARIDLNRTQIDSEGMQMNPEGMQMNPEGMQMNPAAPEIIIEEKDSRPVWILHHAGASHRLDTIAELLVAVRHTCFP